MIVKYCGKEKGKESTVVADGVIINPTTNIIMFVDTHGDRAEAEFDTKTPIIIQDEGGETNAEG